jgi:hypothetical protein
MSKQTDLINIPDAITVSGSNVGIGTTSPSAKLDIQQATAGNIVSAEFDNTDYTANNRNAIKIRQQNAANSSFSTFLGNDRATGNVFLSNDSITADHLVIDSSGNVGIGTTSITSFSNIPNLTVGGSSGGMLTNQVNGTDGMRLYSNSSGTVLNETRNLFLQFATNNTERMRIDSSGNLLVGKTSGPNYNAVGIDLASTGNIQATRSGGEALVLNRQTNDGDIAHFRKDGTLVGSIGVTAGDNLYFAGATGNTKGLYLSDSGVIPCTTSGVPQDGTSDLGAPTVRFRQAYLSGGVYLGGTGSANKLSNYEYGTWTPSFEGDTTAGTYTYVEQQGHYVRVGKQVTAWLNLTNITTGSTGSGRIAITGLPYAANWMSGFNGESVGVVGLHGFAGINGLFIMPIIQDGLNKIFLYHFEGTTNVSDAINVTDKSNNGSDIRGYVTYYIGG